MKRINSKKQKNCGFVLFAGLNAEAPPAPSPLYHIENVFLQWVLDSATWTFHWYMSGLSQNGTGAVFGSPMYWTGFEADFFFFCGPLPFLFSVWSRTMMHERTNSLPRDERAIFRGSTNRGVVLQGGQVRRFRSRTTGGRRKIVDWFPRRRCPIGDMIT